MNLPGMPTVAVSLGTDFGFGVRVLQGIRQQVARQVPWRLLPLHSTQDELFGKLVRERRVDAVIGAFVSDRWLEPLRMAGVPAVNVGADSRIRLVDSVLVDDRAAGRLAARHLRERGWHALGAVHDAAAHAACERLAGFSEAAGGVVATPPPSAGYAADATWGEWLRGLPRPVAVFCTSDFLARRLIAHARVRGLAVPDDMAVLGVGDVPLDSVLAGVGLSSVVLPAERVGERAAARLLRRLACPDEPPDTERVAPTAVAVRESSSHLRGYNPLVTRALAHLEEHLAEPLRMDAVAAACGASRRLLELRFRAALGHGPAAELRARRHALARRLLAETPLALAQVGAAAGYPEPARFWAWFKAVEGVTPGAFRRRSQHPRDATVGDPSVRRHPRDPTDASATFVAPLPAPSMRRLPGVPGEPRMERFQC